MTALHPDAAAFLAEHLHPHRSTTHAPPPAWRLAVHEGGHAVAALTAGWKPCSVEMAGGFGTLRARTDFPAEVHQQWSAHPSMAGARMVMLWAGVEAELAAFRCDPKTAEAGAADDLRHIAQLASGHSTGVRRIITATRERARELVQRHWPAVARVAEGLADVGTVSESALWGAVLMSDATVTDAYRRNRGRPPAFKLRALTAGRTASSCVEVNPDVPPLGLTDAEHAEMELYALCPDAWRDRYRPAAGR